MNDGIIHLDCAVCGVSCEIEGYDVAPSELLIGVFSRAHEHTEAERQPWREMEAKRFQDRDKSESERESNE